MFIKRHNRYAYWYLFIYFSFVWGWHQVTFRSWSQGSFSNTPYKILSLSSPVLADNSFAEEKTNQNSSLQNMDATQTSTLLPWALYERCVQFGPTPSPSLEFIVLAAIFKQIWRAASGPKILNIIILHFEENNFHLMNLVNLTSFRLKTITPTRTLRQTVRRISLLLKPFMEQFTGSCHQGLVQ